MPSATPRGGGGGGGCCCCDCYNRARRRYSDTSQRNAAAAAAAVAAAATDGDEDSVASRLLSSGSPGGPYMQQVMPGLRLGLSWPQMAGCLALVALATGFLAYLGFICWVEAREASIEYTDCLSFAPNASAATCQITLTLGQPLESPVYLYYGLCNAYFNHRRVQTGWSMPQLLGLPVKSKNLDKACRPPHGKQRDSRILPCGALPNAIFNDTLTIFGPLDGKNSTNNATEEGDGQEAVAMVTDGIGLPNNGEGAIPPLPAEKLANMSKPLSWPLPVDQRYRKPFADAEDLWGWLRTPAFPCFRKMSHRITKSLPKGRYRLVIGYNYPVASFSGTKRFILSHKSRLLGGRNLGLALLPAVTCLCYAVLCISTLVECHRAGRRQRQRRRRQRPSRGTLASGNSVV